MNAVTATIFNQIKLLDRAAMMAWGAKDLVAMSDELKFKTSGMVRWKGYVYIKYDAAQDLYNVIFAKIRKMEWIVQKEVNGVFVEDLVNVIDAQVG